MRGLGWTALGMVALSGCELIVDGDDGPGAVPDTGDTGWSPTETGPGWVASAHPCVGNRTDALHADPDGTLWVGCGTTAEGHGLFRSVDGGVRWSEVDSGPLPRFRVSSLQRSGGLLYVGGIHSDGPERVVALDPDTLELSTVFESAGQLWNTFHVGTFRRTAGGAAVAESLTGTDLAWRAADDLPFADGYGWWPGTDSYQLLDLEVHDGGFYGCGSTIGQPPTVFLPAGDLSAGFELQPLTLASFEGELWDLAIDRDGMVAVGVDQQRDVGMVFVSGADPADAGGWRQVDVSDHVPSTPTWMRGACRDGEHIVAVGEKSMLGDGIVLESTDGGATFSLATPSGVGSVPALHECVLLADGSLVVAGADGFVARR